MHVEVLLRNMARLHRCMNYYSFIWGGQYKKMYHCIIFLLSRLRSHLKNSCFGFHQGFQTPRNNKRTRPAASCFHLFFGVWNSLALGFNILLEHLANQLVLMEPLYLQLRSEEEWTSSHNALRFKVIYQDFRDVIIRLRRLNKSEQHGEMCC